MQIPLYGVFMLNCSSILVLIPMIASPCYLPIIFSLWEVGIVPGINPQATCGPVGEIDM